MKYYRVLHRHPPHQNQSSYKLYDLKTAETEYQKTLDRHPEAKVELQEVEIGSGKVTILISTQDR